MWKKSLAMIVIGSLVTGSSFAAPTQVKKMLMKNHVIKSSSVSRKHGQNSQYKFSGTWAGVCSYNGENDEMKIRIRESDSELTIMDIMDEEDVQTIPFNTIKSETNSDEEWYDSFTSRLTRINETTLKLEGAGVFGSQLSNTKKQNSIYSGALTSTYTVNNNQLTIDTSVKLLMDGADQTFEAKCVLNRAQ